MLAEKARSAESAQVARQYAALAIVMSTTVCEVFMNIWFRVRVEEMNDAEARRLFLKDLSFPFASLERKLRVWPKRYLGKDFDVSSGPGAAFVTLKAKRNNIVHFTTSWETFQFENISIHGLANFSEYDALGPDDAAAAVIVAEEFVKEIFRLGDVPEVNLPGLMHGWTGKFA
jgi:hypothetical protein